MSAVLQGRQRQAEAKCVAGSCVALAGLSLAQAVDEQVRGRLAGRCLADQHAVNVHQHLQRGSGKDEGSSGAHDRVQRRGSGDRASHVRISRI